MMPKIPILKPIQDNINNISSSQEVIKLMSKGGIPQNDRLLWIIRLFFNPFILCTPDDFLTPEEIEDIKQSRKELHDGKFRKFSSVEECIDWLKRD